MPLTRRHPIVTLIRKDLIQKEQLKASSMLVPMETEDSLRRGAIMVVTKKIGLICADLLYHKTKNIILLLCTPTVLIYNCELGIINSSEFFVQENSGIRVMYSQSIFFLVRCGGRLPHEVLRTPCFIFL